VSPVSSFRLVQDSLGDPDMREHVEELIRSASKSIEAKLTFLRYALGSVGMQAGYADLHEAKNLCSAYMEGFRADLEWGDTPEIQSYAQVRLAMNLMMIATSALPRGGLVKITSEAQGDKSLITVTGEGPRILLPQEKKDSLNGVEPEGGWVAKAIQPYFAKVCAEEIDTSIDLTEAEGSLTLTVLTPNQ
jgi:histidine phosphotransferase ChpT